MNKLLLSLILVVSIVIAGLLYLGFIDQIAQATESYSDDFSTYSGLWTHTGSAYRDQTNQSIVSTESDYHQAGVAFFKHPIAGSFTASFSYLVGEGTSGLSGDTLVLFFTNRSNQH